MEARDRTTTRQLAKSMGQLTATDLLRGLLTWTILTILFGALTSWIWVLRRLLRREPLLPETPIVERRKPPWGVGTILLVMVIYVLVSHYAFEGYARATRGEHAKGRGEAPIRVEKKDAQGNGHPDAGIGRGEEGPKGHEEPRPHEPEAGRAGRSDEAESLPWGLSLMELMLVQGAINGSLIVLLPCLARLTSKARLRDLGVSLRGWRRQAAIGIVAVLFLMPIVYAVQVACIHYLDVPDSEARKHPLERMLRKDFSLGTAYLAFVTAVILAPLFEELLFRGLLQSWLIKTFDRFAGRFRPSATPDLPKSPLPGEPVYVGPVAVNALYDPDLDRVSADEATANSFWEAVEETEKTVWEERPPAESHGARTVPDLPAAGSQGFSSGPEAPYRPRSSAGTGAAIILTSLIFAALHAAQWPAPIPLFLLALGLGIVYQRTGSLIAPVCMHAVFNGFSTLMLFYVTLGGPVKEKPEARPVLERVAPVEKEGSSAPKVAPNPPRGKT
jgi:membrane protease YdiL (CAAX protease family)